MSRNYKIKRRAVVVEEVCTMLDVLYREISLVDDVIRETGNKRNNSDTSYKNYLELRATFRYFKRKLDNLINMYAKDYDEIKKHIDFEIWYEPIFRI